MVEQTFVLNDIFSCLSDPTRRDILRRVRVGSMTVGDIARHYTISLAGVAKHLRILEQAGLVTKTRQGKTQMVSLNTQALIVADNYIRSYRQLWEQRLDNLDILLKEQVN